MFEIGDLVQIHNYMIDSDGPDPNGFVGFITEATIMLDNYAEDGVENGKLCYTVNLPIEWQTGKHSWTFVDEDLVLLETVEEL